MILGPNHFPCFRVKLLYGDLLVVSRKAVIFMLHFFLGFPNLNWRLLLVVFFDTLFPA